MKTLRDCPQPAACSLQPAASALGPPTASSLRPTACFYSDRLGSTRATTVLTHGYGSTTRNYYPFGEEIGSTANNQFKFASTYRDSTTGLDYAVNRYYASGMGRFLTVDPKSSSARPQNPGTWNRYSYGGNNPVNNADPNGLDYRCRTWFDPEWGVERSTCTTSGDGNDEGEIDPPADPPPSGLPSSALAQFAALSTECQQGLTMALTANAGTNPEVAAQLRLSALGRAGGMTGVLAKAAGEHGIDFAFLAAIGIRESGFQDINQPNGQGVGVFQIDLGRHPEVTAAQAHDLAWSADWAANFLAGNMAALAAKFPNFTSDQLLQATAASYNLGVGGISGNPNTIDVGTPRNNYGSSVVNLMKCFQ